MVYRHQRQPSAVVQYSRFYFSSPVRNGPRETASTPVGNGLRATSNSTIREGSEGAGNSPAGDDSRETVIANGPGESASWPVGGCFNETTSSRFRKNLNSPVGDSRRQTFWLTVDILQQTSLRCLWCCRSDSGPYTTLSVKLKI